MPGPKLVSLRRFHSSYLVLAKIIVSLLCLSIFEYSETLVAVAAVSFFERLLLVADFTFFIISLDMKCSSQSTM